MSLFNGLRPHIHVGCALVVAESVELSCVVGTDPVLWARDAKGHAVAVFTFFRVLKVVENDYSVDIHLESCNNSCGGC
jgi:hypothetical protein